MLIYVLRHGITQWNKLKKVQGAMDIPLAPEGIELAKRTGEALKDVPFDICFTSPLARARQTAHYVLGNRQIPVIEDKRIQEIDFGVLEGSRFKDEQGKIISHEMEIFFEEPQKFERPQNGENISDIHHNHSDDSLLSPAFQQERIENGKVWGYYSTNGNGFQDEPAENRRFFSRLSKPAG